MKHAVFIDGLEFSFQKFISELQNSVEAFIYGFYKRITGSGFVLVDFTSDLAWRWNAWFSQVLFIRQIKLDLCFYIWKVDPNASTKDEGNQHCHAKRKLKALIYFASLNHYRFTRKRKNGRPKASHFFFGAFVRCDIENKMNIHSYFQGKVNIFLFQESRSCLLNWIAFRSSIYLN